MLSAIRNGFMSRRVTGSSLSRIASVSRRQPQFNLARRTYFEWSTSVSTIKNWTQHEGVANWVLDRIRLAQPQRVHLCDGSERENTELLNMMTQSGTLIKLNDKLRPNSYLARSPASDVARVEERTFICSENKADAGFTNNWTEPEEMQNKLNKLFEGCMRGRTMYVIPFSMGPIGSPFAKLGVQITDSPYVVVSMRVMTRMGKEALDQLGSDGDFVPCTHSVGMPLQRGQEDVPWPCSPDPTNKWIVHFPEQHRIWSFGSGYGGNALLGKKCLALRIGSVMGREEGWLAEHMLIVGITNPQGVKKYIAAAFPSACGKTNLAMMLPKLPGWKMTTVGDDIAWLRIGRDGRLWAINPEAGFFGVAPGTSDKTNPICMQTMKKNTVFTNVGITRQNDVWWEGMTDVEPDHVQSWLRVERFQDSGFEAAHPNSRFTVPASQCPIIDEAWDSKEGVPISAIIFGGRRSSTVPLVFEARDWNHGVFVGAMMNSETTAAAAGKRGVLRADPFAMRPFCGYNMGDYFGHWLSFAGRTEPAKLPKIFHVNWFRKGAKGKFLWPGFGDNVRVLKWIFERSEAKDGAQSVETPIGRIPTPGSLDLSGLQVEDEAMTELFQIDNADWKGEVTRARAFFANFKDRMPAPITAELDKLEQRLDGKKN